MVEGEGERKGRKSAEKSTEQPLKENPSKSPSSLSPPLLGIPLGKQEKRIMWNGRWMRESLGRREKKRWEKKTDGMCFSTEKKNPFLLLLFFFFFFFFFFSCSRFMLRPYSSSSSFLETAVNVEMEEGSYFHPSPKSGAGAAAAAALPSVKCDTP